MTIYIILFGVFFGVGLFFILADVCKLPTIATGKALICASQSSVKKASSIDTIFADLSMKFNYVMNLEIALAN